MSTARRRPVLYTLLAGVLGWSGWIALHEPTDDTEVIEPARSHVSPAPRPAERPRGATSAAPPGPPAAPRLALMRANLFPAQTWTPPPPPPPPAPVVPPPPPQAPALPYAYLGRWLENGETTWYLTRGKLPLAVRTGQVLDGAWRLEQAAAGRLDFTYLPLNQTRSLRTGD